MSEINNIEFVKNEEVKNLSSIKTKGMVGGVFYPENETEIKMIYDFLKINNINFDIIGNGSNILFSNNSSKKLFICTKKMQKTVKKYKNSFIFSSSMKLSEIYSYCQKYGFSGFEKLGTIPGTLGGAIKMNAGCFGDNIFDNLVWVKVCKNGRTVFLKKEKIKFDYRKTNLDDVLILSAKFELKPKSKCQISKDFSYYCALRNEKQPKGYSLGSIFKNPPNMYAGKLIEDCGLKGQTQNDAFISEKHANFIINKKDANYEDIVYLINLAKQKVKEKYHIDLNLEIKIF